MEENFYKFNCDSNYDNFDQMNYEKHTQSNMDLKDQLNQERFFNEKAKAMTEKYLETQECS